jgi:hypothetical protein
MEGSTMAEKEVFWPAIFLAVLDDLFIGWVKCESLGSLVTWTKELEPDRRSSDAGRGWLREVVMQLSACKDVMETIR